MQKGTGVHSRVRGVLICLGVVCGFLVPSRWGARGGGPVRWDARGGVREPDGLYRYDGGAPGGRRIAVVTSCAHPYMLDDCRRSFVAAGYRSERRAVWLDWSLLHHPLFREDIVSIVVGARMEGGSLLCTVRPLLRRVMVKGFPTILRFSYAYACSYRWGDRGGIGIEGYTIGGYDSKSAGITGLLAFRTRMLGIIVNTRMDGGRTRGGAIGMELDMGGGLTFLSGYDAATDAISAGVSYRGGACRVGIAWCEHAELGSTISIGAGRVWRR